MITPCTWSYFGDPRAVAYRNWVYTGCIGTDGKVKLDQFNVKTGRQKLLTLFRGLEVDDHNNPSLVFFRRKLYAFASEHAGYVYPRDRNSRMEYRVSKSDGGLGRRWGGTRHGAARAGLRARLHVPEPGRLGQAPVPLHARPVLVPVLHVDGGRQALEPAADARARAAQLRPQRAPVREVRRGARRLDPDDVLRRPPGLLQEQPLLHALQARPLLQGGRHASSGTTRDLPFRLSQLDVVQRYSASQGPAVADGHRLGLGRRAVDRLLQPRRLRRRLPLRALQRRAGGRRASSRRPAARCSATATAASRSTTPTRAGSC